MLRVGWPSGDWESYVMYSQWSTVWYTVSSVVQSEPAVVMVLCGLWSVHLTTPDLRTRRTGGSSQQDLYLSRLSFPPSSLPASLLCRQLSNIYWKSGNFRSTVQFRESRLRTVTWDLGLFKLPDLVNQNRHKKEIKWVLPIKYWKTCEIWSNVSFSLMNRNIVRRKKMNIM